MSPFSSRRWSAVVRAKSWGRSVIALPKYASTSDGAGRCIPGIFTYPPRGIEPSPYSIPFLVVLASAGGKPT